MLGLLKSLQIWGFYLTLDNLLWFGKKPKLEDFVDTFFSLSTQAG